MQDVVIFVDEYGDTSLATEKAGTSEMYIITAVIVPAESLAKFESEHARLFGFGEAKSSKLRTESRRVKRLKKLAELDFRYSSLIVHKARLNKNSGYRFKGPFFKNLHQQMFERFCKLYGNIEIVCDGYGNHKFMDECVKYFQSKQKQLMGGLISMPEKYSFKTSFADSSKCAGVRVADLIAGTQRKVIDDECSKGILDCLRNHASSVKHYPPHWKTLEISEPRDDMDSLIRELSLRSALQYMELHEFADNEDKRIHVEVLRYLLDSYFDNDCQYVYGDKIKGYLEKELGFVGIKEQKFRKIIADLRESNVAIASKSSGYKIPTCFADIERFIRKVHHTVHPYLRRLGVLRGMLHEASQGRLDILRDEDLRAMRDYIDTASTGTSISSGAV